MKKFINILTISLLTFFISLLAFNYKVNSNPNLFYQVYLNGKVLGTINSKAELERYIDKQNNQYKEKFGVKTIYAPNGLQIKKIETYNGETSNVKDIYKKIAESEPFTIKGYQFILKKKENQENDKDVVIYTLSKGIFNKAVESTISTFVGSENYKNYLEHNQNEITETGTIIENIYVDDEITVKSVNIPVTENVFTDSSALAKFLVFGNNTEQKQYTVKVGDTIEDVAFANEISVEEFLISNPNFSSAKNLLFPGQIVNIGITDPQLSVVKEEYSVKDQEVAYSTELKYDSSKVIGDDEIIQQGENGLERITQRIKYVNGQINYVDPISKEIRKPTINKIVLKGEKYVATVGGIKNWVWPTRSGYTISSDYIYRINPINGRRELHAAIDISGTGYGSPIYAVTNGVTSEVSYRYQDGNYVCINHNNGYYTCYAHMARQAVKVNETVERGQVIGYVGNSGWATGPHLHFEVWIGKPWNGGRRINPWTMYR